MPLSVRIRQSSESWSLGSLMVDILSAVTAGIPSSVSWRGDWTRRRWHLVLGACLSSKSKKNWAAFRPCSLVCMAPYELGRRGREALQVRAASAEFQIGKCRPGTRGHGFLGDVCHENDCRA